MHVKYYNVLYIFVGSQWAADDADPHSLHRHLIVKEIVDLIKSYEPLATA
jgi:hypothetical protein